MATASALSQTNLSLPRSFPEAEGVSSKDIMTFLDSAAALKGLELHSFMFLRHGKVIAEGSWEPYKPRLVHTMNSCSKVFCATAMGFALNEKLLTLDDKVISFFPNELPDTISTRLAKMSVRDLLTMSSGMAVEPNWIRATDNWVKGYLTTPIAYEPGTRFQYSSIGSYIVGAIITKASGKKLMDYLEPRLFEPLGITGIDWDTDSQGINTGGSGMRLKIEDMAKLGQLYLQKGKWNGKQLLPEAWVRDATSYHIDQAPTAASEVKAQSDWMQGYGYQFWRCRNGAFRGDGAGGQFIVVMPEKDAVVVLQAEISDMQAELNLVWDYLLLAIKPTKLAVNANTINLKKRLSSLKIYSPAKVIDPPLAKQISGKLYDFESNDMGLKSLSLTFVDDLCYTKISVGNAEYKLFFGNGKWINGSTAMPQSNTLQPAKTTGGGYVPQADGTLKFRNDGIMLQKVAGSYTWKNDHTLELALQYNESLSGGKITCVLTGNKADVSVKFSNDAKLSKPAFAKLK